MKVVARFKEIVQGEDRQGLPRPTRRTQLWGAIEAVFQLVGQPPRRRLPQDARHPRELGHCVQHTGDGLRQPRRHERHRRRVHARSVDRRAPALRRVAAERAGRGRRRRHPHAACRSAPREKNADDSLEKRMPEPYARLVEIGAKLEKHFRDMQDLEFTDPGGQALHAAVPLGEAHQQGRRARRGRDGEGGPHHEGGGAAPRRRRVARPAAPPDARSRTRRRSSSRAASPRARAPRRARIVFSADEAERLAGQGEAGDPRARRDVARGHPRHEARRAASSPRAAA